VIDLSIDPPVSSVPGTLGLPLIVSLPVGSLLILLAPVVEEAARAADTRANQSTKSGIAGNGADQGAARSPTRSAGESALLRIRHSRAAPEHEDRGHYSCEGILPAHGSFSSINDVTALQGRPNRDRYPRRSA
jgi:hypothetical protein